ncbi:hypothetical protein [Silvimonas iriomotensis]|uniref:Ysc84 actin-binding domain-containing protein n=1 Tax=Silvimonas iriomotensis TaxID=449662 RepID=A0ABQ2P5R2_9NEIS|nr:hypothetical protein [Silvimonas iriomotensis]GGP18511.1 hypothetical protein GCM10010970_05350 [Silvimonas iriomotensis]
MRWVAMLVVALGLSGQALAATGSNVPEKRHTVDMNARDLIDKLGKADADAKAKIGQSAGYAAFTNGGMGILLPGGFGTGVVQKNGSDKKTYMRMFHSPSGWGSGIKTYSVVFVFDTQEGLDSFQARGYVLSQYAVDASKSAGKGEAEIMPGVWMYQLDAKGNLAPALTGQGVKFYLDQELN